ncbi:alkaline phosphatase family protein [Phocaeicola sp.]|uniref:alkaline phosphatase family protein n=1 Tax=Phocaeicola sp. TaxID=2773926 RepID=UPI003AB37AC9
MNYRLFTVILFCLGWLSDAVADNSKYVILITIDGMHAGMVTDPEMPSPYLKMMKREGLFVDKVKGVPPTATYPSHTSIVTGALPVHHRIFYNSPFVFNKDSVVSYWYADSIKAPTIWQAAKESGLTTASLFWPVSTKSRWIDYNIPEYWSVKRVANQLDFIKPVCTPSGILDELEQNAVGRLDHLTFGAGSINRDARTAYMANYIMNKYHPNLMTIHLITTDYAQHATGMQSERTRMAVASVDHAIGLIVENLKQTRRMDSTTVIVCGDHGFSNISQAIAPNVWLTRAGLLSEKPGGDWKACFHGNGSVMFLYLRDSNDKKTLQKVERIIQNLPVETRRLFRVVSQEELTAMGGDPKVALALEPIAGISVSTNRTGADVLVKKGGSHGYFSGIDPTCFMVYGCNVPDKGKELQTMRQIDIAPYVMHLLGVDYKFVDGKLPQELF